MPSTHLTSAYRGMDYGSLVASSCAPEPSLLPWILTKPGKGDLASVMIEMLKRDMVRPALRCRTIEGYRAEMAKNSRSLVRKLDALSILAPDPGDQPDEVTYQIAYEVGGEEWRQAFVDGLAHIRRANEIIAELAPPPTDLSEFQKANIIFQAGARIAWIWSLVSMLTLHDPSAPRATPAVLNFICRNFIGAGRSVYIHIRALEEGEDSKPDLDDLMDEALALEALEDMNRTGAEPIPWSKVRRSAAS